MTRLEARYRWLLRLLPRWYRAEREEELVAVFLAGEAVRGDGVSTSRPDGGELRTEPGSGGEVEIDQIRGEYGWPDRAEVAATAALAVRTRFGGVNAPGPARRWGDTVRLVALLGLLTQAAFAIVSVAASVVASWLAPPQVVDSFTEPLNGSDWWPVARMVVPLMWIPAYLLLVTGRRRAARVTTLVALLSSVVTVVGGGLQGEMLSAAVLGGWVVWLPAACVFLGFHRDAPGLASRPWLMALPAAALAASAVGWVGMLVAPSVAAVLTPWTDGSWAVVLGGLGLLVLRSHSPERVPTPWLAAVAVLSVPLVLAQVGWLAIFGLPSGIPIIAVSLPPAALAFLAAVLAVSATRQRPGPHRDATPVR